MKTAFHSPAEAAEFLGLSTRTIRRAVKAGELPAVIYNRKVWRLSAVDIAAWYASRGGRLSAIGTKSTKESPDGLQPPDITPCSRK